MLFGARIIYTHIERIPFEAFRSPKNVLFIAIAWNRRQLSPPSIDLDLCDKMFAFRQRQADGVIRSDSVEWNLSQTMSGRIRF